MFEICQIDNLLEPLFTISTNVGYFQSFAVSNRMETIITTNTEETIEVWKIDDVSKEYRVYQAIKGVQLTDIKLANSPLYEYVSRKMLDILNNPKKTENKTTADNKNKNEKDKSGLEDPEEKGLNSEERNPSPDDGDSEDEKPKNEAVVANG